MNHEWSIHFLQRSPWDIQHTCFQQVFHWLKLFFWYGLKQHCCILFNVLKSYLWDRISVEETWKCCMELDKIYIESAVLHSQMLYQKMLIKNYWDIALMMPRYLDICTRLHLNSKFWWVWKVLHLNIPIFCQKMLIKMYQDLALTIPTYLNICTQV